LLGDTGSAVMLRFPTVSPPGTTPAAPAPASSPHVGAQTRGQTRPARVLIPLHWVNPAQPATPAWSMQLVSSLANGVIGQHHAVKLYTTEPRKCRSTRGSDTNNSTAWYSTSGALSKGKQRPRGVPAPDARTAPWRATTNCSGKPRCDTFWNHNANATHKQTNCVISACERRRPRRQASMRKAATGALLFFPLMHQGCQISAGLDLNTSYLQMGPVGIQGSRRGLEVEGGCERARRRPAEYGGVACGVGGAQGAALEG
jgi:hypothetical protein